MTLLETIIKSLTTDIEIVVNKPPGTLRSHDRCRHCRRSISVLPQDLLQPLVHPKVEFGKLWHTGGKVYQTILLRRHYRAHHLWPASQPDLWQWKVSCARSNVEVIHASQADLWQRKISCTRSNVGIGVFPRGDVWSCLFILLHAPFCEYPWTLVLVQLRQQMQLLSA